MYVVYVMYVMYAMYVMYVCMYGWMDAWKDVFFGWMDGWMNDVCMKCMCVRV